MSALKPLSPAEVSRRLAKGRVTLVDVREPHEYAREHIAGAVSLPLSRVRRGNQKMPAGQAIVFHCKSGMRTKMHCDALAAQAEGKAYVLEGGLLAWKQAGLPVEHAQGTELSLRPFLFAGGAAMALLVLISLLTRGW